MRRLHQFFVKVVPTMSTMWTYDIVPYVGGSDIGHNVDEKNINIVSYVGPTT